MFWKKKAPLTEQTERQKVPNGIKSEMVLLLEEAAKKTGSVKADEDLLERGRQALLAFESTEKRKELVVEREKTEVQIKQAQALTTLAEGVRDIATFLNGGGLSSLLSQHARSQIAQGILGGLASHDGRDALDARTMGQNALEINYLIEALFSKAEEKQRQKEKAEPTDPELHNAEADFEQWLGKKGNK